jgi:hypothetical protein
MSYSFSTHEENKKLLYHISGVDHNRGDIAGSVRLGTRLDRCSGSWCKEGSVRNGSDLGSSSPITQLSQTPNLLKLPSFRKSDPSPQNDDVVKCFYQKIAMLYAVIGDYKVTFWIVTGI